MSELPIKKDIYDLHPLLSNKCDEPRCLNAELNEGVAMEFAREDSTIEQVEAFEDVLNEKNLNKVEELDPFCLRDGLVNEMYYRTLLMPANMIITGRLHQEEYIDIMILGECTVESFCADGSKEEATRYKGFHIFDGVPGRKRVLYTHSDTLWVTVDRARVENKEEAFDVMSSAKSKEYLKKIKLLKEVL